MKTRSRLSLGAALALVAALSGGAIARADGARTARPERTWKKAAAHRRAALPPRKVKRVRSRLVRAVRRPRVVATASGSHHPALGLAGPLGPYGPLGRLGPAIDTGWSPSRWMRAVGDWRHLSALLTELGGPLSEDGPLGPGGPQGDAHDSFPSSFLPGGGLSALGPDGPLGALGPLGPLGPMGAHGFARDAGGRYLEGGKVRRTVTVPYRRGRRAYPLFEVYDAEVAAAMEDNDTSFMAVGSLPRGGATSFPFRSRGGEQVQIALTPHAQLDRFRLEILDGAGNVIARSDEQSQVNRVELRVPPRTRLQARVSLVSSGHLLPGKPFSLSVVGRPER